MYGKLVDNKLELVGNILKGTGWTITNPTEQQYLEKGYKHIIYQEKPTYDIDNYKLVETYYETTNIIEVIYNVVELSNDEKEQKKQDKIKFLEDQVDTLNSKLLRDVRVLLDDNATEQEKTEAKVYYNRKLEEIYTIIEQITSLKN